MTEFERKLSEALARDRLRLKKPKIVNRLLELCREGKWFRKIKQEK